MLTYLAYLSVVVTLCAAAKNKLDLDLQYPDIFIIGAQKCGTTSLNALLLDHPDFCNGGHKEKHFFSEGEDWLNKTDAFLDEFSKCKKRDLTVDATPSYVFFDYVPDRIKRSYTAHNLRSKKFILILREPAARHFSEYQRLVRGCMALVDEPGYMNHASSFKSTQEKLETAEKKCYEILKETRSKEGKFDLSSVTIDNLQSFPEWVNSFFGTEELSRGKYLAQITNWLQFFNRRQLMIINFQTLVSHTTETVMRLSKFLDIDGTQFYVSKKNTTIVLPSPPKRNHYVDYEKCQMDCETYSYLERWYQVVNQGLFHVINNHTSRPASEPYFEPFDSSMHKCVWTNVSFAFNPVNRRNQTHIVTNHTRIPGTWNLTEVGGI